MRFLYVRTVVDCDVLSWLERDVDCFDSQVPSIP